jgi:23S rRNA (cytidine1920-2'-O)/16S rRNA (cytidine1409-2'-O)-methyltransferase
MQKVTVNGRPAAKSGVSVSESDQIKLLIEQQYVSRAALKLASVADTFALDFRGKTVLDVGSSTGGFTDFALRRGANKVIAVDVGSDQMHRSLRNNPQIELHEKTDIRSIKKLAETPEIVVIDVSFISLQEILPHIKALSNSKTEILAMVKPQFEAGDALKHKGVIKNESMRRDILKDFETWAKQHFKLVDKADSQVSGEKGNRERFYKLTTF